ncbi:MAG TPA: DUF2505 domain-containing protein [Pseudonocardia sp.]|jgi:hypothetical protein|nr:DUF2505 domain-containing protein [Pseudonocardia sp.]
MARQIDFRAPLPRPAETVYATMVDAEFLRARLQQLGGPGAELLEHQADPAGARYRLRHGLDKSVLPPLVQNLVSGNLVIERTETIRQTGPGHYEGTVDVQIPGAPVTAVGTMQLHDAPAGSEFAVHATVKVNIPLFGGRIEETVAEQVRNLVQAETAFTERRLRV